MLSRRNFLGRLGTALLPGFLLSSSFRQEAGRVQTVSGTLPSSKMGTTLPHEHVMVDFIGAEQTSPFRYEVEEVIAKALPHLQRIKSLGCRTLVECTPAYLGRDPLLLKMLSERSGLKIITNTGFYSAVQGKYLPSWVAERSAKELAELWIAEYEKGIDGSGVRPGFIKTSVDETPLKDYNKKVLEAAAITHRATGLTIACHCGAGSAAPEALEVVRSNGVAGDAFIWVHAQNALSKDDYLEVAERRAWIELDGLSHDSADDHLDRVIYLREKGILSRVLLSHDAGWYNVGEEGGGTYRGHDFLFTDFIRSLRSSGFTSGEIRQLTQRNPAAAFTVQKRLL